MISEAQFLAECAKRKITPYKSNVGSLAKPMFTSGFTFTTTAGGTVTFNINLSGNVSELLGLVVIGGLDADIGTLKVNNDILLQDTSLAAFNPSINIYKDAQYFKLPRKLFGTDVITLQVSAAAAHQFRPIFYCLPK